MVSINGAALSMSVDRGIPDAPRFGLITKKNVALFIEITCLHLGGFPPGTHPKQALAILSSYGIDPERKLDRYRQWALSMKNREVENNRSWRILSERPKSARWSDAVRLTLRPVQCLRSTVPPTAPTRTYSSEPQDGVQTPEFEDALRLPASPPFARKGKVDSATVQALKRFHGS
jgi:hypothetical protein